MPYIDKNRDNEKILAELLLSTYFPEVKEWKAEYGSFFSRNYSGDLISVQQETNTVSLSRNGIYDILPEKMFFDVEELRNKEPREFALLISEIYEMEKNIKDYFLPFDTFFFNQSMRLHKVVGHMIDNKTELLLRTLFDYHIENEENIYVRQLAPLLLNVTEIRGDFNMLKSVLAVILDCRVDYNLPRQDEVVFTVHKIGLNSREYLAYMKELEPLFDFVQYWFVPMEMDCHYKVKDYQQKFILSVDRPLVLDYNTQI